MPRLTKDHLKKLHTPVIYILGGQKDIAYVNGMDDFKHIAHLPAFAANLEVGHGGTYARPHGGDFAKVATAWLQSLAHSISVSRPGGAVMASP